MPESTNNGLAPALLFSVGHILIHICSRIKMLFANFADGAAVLFASSFLLHQKIDTK